LVHIRKLQLKSFYLAKASIRARECSPHGVKSIAVNFIVAIGAGMLVGGAACADDWKISERGWRVVVSRMPMPVQPQANLSAACVREHRVQIGTPGMAVPQRTGREPHGIMRHQNPGASVLLGEEFFQPTHLFAPYATRRVPKPAIAGRGVHCHEPERADS